MDILKQINRDKQDEVNLSLGGISKRDLRKKKSDERVPLDFRKALQSHDLSLIAEVKKASPSKGLIRADFRPVEIAISYEKYGANCISVLTERRYFQGRTQYLKDIRQKIALPLLRKDFIVDARQIRESYELGADAILLIVASLSKNQLQEYREMALEFGLTSLVEVHTLAELETALESKSDLIGINNRDLATFKTDLQTSIRLKAEIPQGITTVSESGIHKRGDSRVLKKHGFDAILVGETLIKQSDPGQGIKDLLGEL